MKLIVLIILIAFGIIAWALLNPDQQDNMLAVKKAIGIDSDNPYATKLKTLSDQQNSIAKALNKGSSSLDGAQMTGKLVKTQGEIISQLEKLIEALERTGKEQEIIFDIEDSDIIDDMISIQSHLKDNNASEAETLSRACARLLEEWAKEIDGSE